MSKSKAKKQSPQTNIVLFSQENSTHKSKKFGVFLFGWWNLSIYDVVNGTKRLVGVGWSAQKYNPSAKKITIKREDGSTKYV